MSQVVLEAHARAKNGSGEARRIRRAGRIPGVLYGRSGEAHSIDLDALEFTNGVKNISESTIVKVDVDGKSYDAFVKDTQRNIMDGKILHVDFYEVESGVALRARVSIHLQGSPIGVRDGGILEFPLHEIEVECFPKDLPERIDLDVSALSVNQSIHVRDIPLASGIRLISGSDQVVALVKYAKEEAVVAPTAEEAAAAGPAATEPAAAGAAAPAASGAKAASPAAKAADTK
ncbi:50S ribosomal protein L25 [Leadbettera azotonutricia]|uniref:Large ribosomal subunit protein bL25 n=1 Tax=Leadbettera azotonutricia (strain ATCC BAA-888 / DSM 13862 / ZAS-9) TaxID=545695 RepID=F5Y7C9_LEAAZ|nr:50S ribosomal protein L25 [Leadbettera azotonutricia]AEF82905.1 ribosomal protein L25, Ctc-form [Leadbettera azotonutricia ZAS-9]